MSLTTYSIFHLVHDPGILEANMHHLALPDIQLHQPAVTPLNYAINICLQSSSILFNLVLADIFRETLFRFSGSRNIGPRSDFEKILFWHTFTIYTP